MHTLEDFIAKHERVVLLLSSGKDSAACLKLLRPHLDKVLVIWVNPGNPYPETMEYMSKVQRSVPHFQMAIGHQRKFIEQHGYPADIVPLEATPLGRVLSDSTGPRLINFDACCRANMWEPAQRALRESRITGCIRGDKACDPMHSDIASGVVHDGVEYLFPIWDWSEQQVRDYLGDDIPPSYTRGLKSSLDCINCTAYLSHNPGRITDLKQRHPDAYAEVEPVVRWMRDATQRHLAAMEMAL